MNVTRARNLIFV